MRLAKLVQTLLCSLFGCWWLVPFLKVTGHSPTPRSPQGLEQHAASQAEMGRLGVLPLSQLWGTRHWGTGAQTVSHLLLAVAFMILFASLLVVMLPFSMLWSFRH